MPLPHEKAAIDAAHESRKPRLVEAALALDRIRAENPGVNNPQDLPEPARREAMAALAAFRRGPALGLPEAATLLLLAAGLALLFLAPVRVFLCDPGGPGLVACRVSERLLGLATLREDTISNIASTRIDSRRETSESRDSEGRSRTSTTLIVELVLRNPSGGTLWQASGSNLVGASFESVAVAIDEMLTAERTGPLVRAHAAWPALLAGTLFVTMGASAFGSAIGLLLRDRGFIPQTVYRVVFYWGLFVAPALLSVTAWMIALLGGDPPSWLAFILRLS